MFLPNPAGEGESNFCEDRAQTIASGFYSLVGSFALKASGDKYTAMCWERPLLPAAEEGRFMVAAQRLPASGLDRCAQVQGEVEGSQNSADVGTLFFIQ